MPVTLESILFNHDPNSAREDALTIRHNRDQLVALPEWRRGVTRTPASSVAAYAMQDTLGHTISILAEFSCRIPWIQAVDIRALDPAPPTLGNILGEVTSRRVSFDASGATGPVRFELENVQLWNRGVGIYPVLWRWQYRLQPAGPWIDFAASVHKIFVVLRVPTDPWEQDPFHAANINLPWTEVLEHACQWARGATSHDQAAALITQAINDLGPHLIGYDCPGGGLTHYTSLFAPNTFDCTAFLDRLRGGFGRGYYVNCVDCATIVSTFANSLGCDLWQSAMFGERPFGLNPVLAVGSNVWQTPCGWGSFPYHEVAWKGACTAGDEVFDACLQINGGSSIVSPVPLLPAGIRFGEIGDGLYRDRLATPAGRVNCAPQPQFTRRRRPIW